MTFFVSDNYSQNDFTNDGEEFTEDYSNNNKLDFHKRYLQSDL